jgi:gamma-glutamyl:cysteine ligase YbdK (ATP-grasp superfamily)
MATDSSVGQISRSIEVEYWVIDEDGSLTAPGSLVESPGAEREFVEPMLEVKTPPCETMAELREQLLGRLRAVLTRANEQGKKLVPLATPIHAEEIADLESVRTEIQDRTVGPNFEYVRHCAGTHIHVEQVPGREVEQLNTLIALDPALALVNSSPYYDGERLAEGARSALYRRMAYAQLPNQGELWPYTANRTEYAQRIERRYEEFITQAVIAGIDRTRAEAAFEPEGAVWTPVQLRQQFSTVEWRSPDTAIPSQVLQLADDIVSTVERAVDNPVTIEGGRGSVSDTELTLPTFDAVREYVDAAISGGLSGGVTSYLERMDFDVKAYDPLSPAVDCGDSIRPQTAREIRIEYADRLEADLRQSIAAE